MQWLGRLFGWINIDLNSLQMTEERHQHFNDKNETAANRAPWWHRECQSLQIKKFNHKSSTWSPQLGLWSIVFASPLRAIQMRQPGDMTNQTKLLRTIVRTVFLGTRARLNATPEYKNVAAISTSHRTNGMRRASQKNLNLYVAFKEQYSHSDLPWISSLKKRIYLPVTLKQSSNHPLSKME